MLINSTERKLSSRSPANFFRFANRSARFQVNFWLTFYCFDLLKINVYNIFYLTDRFQGFRHCQIQISQQNLILYQSSISIKDFVREKKSATETLNLKLNTKPLKFKCGLADGGGGVGRVDPCKAWVPPPSS